MVHEALGRAVLYRLFHGFRLTTGTVFEDQALLRLPSFQLPAMYSANQGSAFPGLPSSKNIDQWTDPRTAQDQPALVVAQDLPGTYPCLQISLRAGTGCGWEYKRK
jgi:hypothetical protein